MNTLLQDIRFGLRMLRKHPGFTSMAVVALGLGIGANTALFSLVYGVLMKPLPYAKGDQLVVLQQDFTAGNVTNIGFSPKELRDYREQSQSLSQMEEYHQMNFLLLDQEPERVRTGVVSAHFFDLLGVKPLLGRNFVEADDRPGADPVVILSYNYWKTKHGGDMNIVGHRFKMNDEIHTVIGVLPAIPQYPRENDVYMPSVACPFRSASTTIENREARLLRVFARLKPTTTIQSAASDLKVIAARLQQTYPAIYSPSSGFTANLDILHNQLTKQVADHCWGSGRHQAVRPR